MVDRLSAVFDDQTALLFGDRRLNPEKLILFGFEAVADRYTYTTGIMGGQFRMTVVIAEGGAVSTRVIDASSEEDYILHRVPRASGVFVGTVRAAHECVLREIAERCFDAAVFRAEYAREIIRYARERYRSELEFLWPRSPGSAVLRRGDNNKWFGVLLALSRRKLGFDSDERVDILNVKMKTDGLDAVLDRQKYLPAYHMNKKHWCTLCLDGSIPLDEIFERIDASYVLAGR